MKWQHTLINLLNFCSVYWRGICKVPILFIVSNPTRLIGSMVLAPPPYSVVLLRVVASLDIGAPEFIVKI